MGLVIGGGDEREHLCIRSDEAESHPVQNMTHERSNGHRKETQAWQGLLTGFHSFFIKFLLCYFFFFWCFKNCLQFPELPDSFRVNLFVFVFFCDVLGLSSKVW